MKIYNAILVGVILLFLVGCANNANKDVPNEVVKTTQKEDTAAKPTTTTLKVESGATSEFKSLMGNRAKLEWMVRYNVKSTAMGNFVSLDMTQYFKGESKMRSDTFAQGIESRAYILDKVYTMCTKMGVDWTCTKLDMPKDNARDTEKEIQNDPSKYAVVADGTMSIANTDAKCYKITGLENDVKARYCYSKEGIPLYAKYDTKDVSTEMIATYYETKVADSEFVLPAVAKTVTVGSTAGAGPGADACSACGYLSGDAKTSCLENCGG